ncbi:MAG: 4-hydroxy-tetrahydrodipicolinate reductase [bacterium]
MIRVVVVGVCGRMGSEVVRLIGTQLDMKVVAGVEAIGHPLIGTTVGAGIVVEELSQVVDEGDVVVDFSTPEALAGSVRICCAAGKPLVTGVTGFKSGEFELLKDASAKIPVLYAANFSVGVAVLKKLVKEAARLLERSWDVHLVEVHHKGKKDVPSGTAQMLLDVIKSEMGHRLVDVNSIRAGDIVGVHQVLFAGPGEHLDLIHRAESRVAFASGVIGGIRWIVGKPPGFYSIENILNLS